MFWGRLIASFQDTTPNFSINKTTIFHWWALLDELGTILTVCLVPLSQQRGDGCSLVPLEFSVLDCWNCCLCTTSHFIVYITDIKWWALISLKRCMNFASQVEQDTLYPTYVSSSEVSDGTQMLHWVSPIGSPQGKGWEGSQLGSWVHLPSDHC